GTASCVFDGATTAGDYVQNSSTTAGDCHDAGASVPAGGQVLGQVLSTNGAGGAYAMILYHDPGSAPSGMQFSSGGTNAGNNQFIGVGAVSNTEGNVQQIVATSGHFTAFYCYSQTAPSANITFTLRLDGANTSLTCTINNGSTSGSTTGASLAFATGDLI